MGRAGTHGNTTNRETLVNLNHRRDFFFNKLSLKERAGLEHFKMSETNKQTEVKNNNNKIAQVLALQFPEHSRHGGGGVKWILH